MPNFIQYSLIGLSLFVIAKLLWHSRAANSRIRNQFLWAFQKYKNQRYKLNNSWSKMGSNTLHDIWNHKIWSHVWTHLPWVLEFASWFFYYLQAHEKYLLYCYWLAWQSRRSFEMTITIQGYERKFNGIWHPVVWLNPFWPWALELAPFILIFLESPWNLVSNPAIGLHG